MRSRGDGGQATVEFALCLPFVALLVAAIVQVSLVSGDQVRLWHAAREAARVAVVDADPRAASEAAERSGLSPVEVEVSPAPGARIVGDPLMVTVRYHPRGHVPLIGELFERLTLEAHATMRIERP